MLLLGGGSLVFSQRRAGSSPWWFCGILMDRQVSWRGIHPAASTGTTCKSGQNLKTRTTAELLRGTTARSFHQEGTKIEFTLRGGGSQWEPQGLEMEPKSAVPQMST